MKDTGGPAFPVKTAMFDCTQSGMTLRDYFAAQALQGELASICNPEGDVCGLALDISDEMLDRLTRHYYRIADAMLKARQA